MALEVRPAHEGRPRYVEADTRGDPYVQPVARKEDRALSRDLLTFAKAKRKYDRNAVLMTGTRMFG
jgi:hypothetical protein